MKNLLARDRGRSVQDDIFPYLAEDLGYVVTYKLIDAAGFVPSHRTHI